MPDLTPEQQQALMMSMLTQRPDMPIPEQTPLDAARGREVVGALGQPAAEVYSVPENTPQGGLGSREMKSRWDTIRRASELEAAYERLRQQRAR